MTKNPFLNALSAVFYIVAVASFMFYGTKHIAQDKTVFIPIAMLSLVTLSAAMMGYIFFFQPVQMYLDGKKKVAVDLFLKTLAIFAGITFLVFILLFSGVLR
ncbi:MAG TPA: hypothetical protein VLG67_05345 [Candidatus Saccharimonadales bacterium]|nr:hypothetical protein [Candidatus Saccharimonadales bacterium]